jgi:two-component SAPR family response regulator
VAPGPAMKPSIRIALLGRFSVRIGEDGILDHVPHKAQELLAYLVLRRGKAHPRESVAEYLWGERDTPNSRKYLRQVLWQLHTGLESLGRSRAAHLLRVESDWLEFAIGDGVSADVVEFEEGFNSVKAVPGEALVAEQMRLLVETAQLYRGDLLEGSPADWCSYDRERFRRMYLALLDKIVEFCESRNEYEAAIAYSMMALRYDRARERSHRSLMRALAASGDRAGAVRQYRRCVEVLRDELAVDPEPETVMLEQRVLAGEVIGAHRERVAATNGRSRPLSVVGAKSAARSGTSDTR